MTAPVSPLRSVLDALEQGAPTVAAVRARTGLDATVVDAVIDHLVRTGRVGTSRFVLGCPGSCGACPAAGAAGDCGGTPEPAASASSTRTTADVPAASAWSTRTTADVPAASAWSTRTTADVPAAAGPHRADLGSGRTLLALWVRRS